MSLLLQVSNLTLPIILALGAILTVGTAVATLLVARTIYKTTLPTRLAETLRANYDAEKARADLAEKDRDALKEKVKTLEGEKSSLSTDYTQLTQLYAYKSVILERLTGTYGRVADVAATGTLKEFLEALESPVRLRELAEGQDIHKTKG